jgi:hypothetical protein
MQTFGFLSGFLLMVLFLPVFGQESSDPLFDSREILEFKILTNLNELLTDVGPKNKDHKARLVYKNSDKKKKIIHIEIETRGNFRKDPQNCNFPPLKLEFEDPESAKGTLFEGQKHLKLVTHCNDTTAGYDQYLLREYFVYQLYQHITPISFKTRLCRVTYRNHRLSAGNTHYAILIEDNDHLAERLGGKEWDKGEPYSPVDSASFLRLALFQYLIRNTDWSVVPMQNTEVVSDSKGMTYPVPYDFDMSAFVHPPNAMQALQVDSTYYFSPHYNGPKVSSTLADSITSEYLDQYYKLMSFVQNYPYFTDKEKTRFIDYFVSFFNQLEKPDSELRKLMEGRPENP